MPSLPVSRDRDSGRTSIRTEISQRHCCNSSFDWNGAREPYILATENDTLNGLGMLFMKLLTGRAQIFADVRTYWSPDAVKKATGYELEGVAKEAGGFPASDQFRSSLPGCLWRGEGRER